MPRNTTGQCSYRTWKDAVKGQMLVVRSFITGNKSENRHILLSFKDQSCQINLIFSSDVAAGLADGESYWLWT